MNLLTFLANFRVNFKTFHILIKEQLIPINRRVESVLKIFLGNVPDVSESPRKFSEKKFFTKK